MSPKKKVPKLSRQCLEIVSSKVIYSLSDDEGMYYVAVKKYVSDATFEVLQELLQNILNSVNLDAATRFSCLQILLRNDVRKLSTGIFPHSYYEKILEVIAWEGRGLHQLDLKGVWVREHPILLSKLVSSLNNLKVLIIPHMANDAVLKSLLLCKSLSVLDISGEASFTSEGLRSFKSESLRILDIGNFGKRDICEAEVNNAELLANLVENLPNLRRLRVYSFVGSVIKFLHNENQEMVTKLRELHDIGTTGDTFKAILRVCPNLEYIHLDSADAGVIHSLTELKNLNSVKLTKPRSEDELLYYLRSSGSKLRELKLNHNKNFTLDLSELCLFSPNLVTLECYQMKLSFLEFENYFMALRIVELLYCDISDYSIKMIMANSPFLEKIAVGSVLNLTDGDMFRLCAECDLACLREILFTSAKALTSTSIELLMGHCPKLCIIGQLTGWDIAEEELMYLQAVISITNTDLTLLPKTLL